MKRNVQLEIGPARAGHLAAGAALFGLGFSLALLNRFLVIEFIKGFMQPVTILAGIVALLAALLGKPEFRSFNAILAGALLVVGAYGLYDEFYAVLDFLHGFVPLFLTAAGIVALACGFLRLK